MKNWILRWVVNALALAIVAHLNIGVKYDTLQGLLLATVAIGFANSVVRPILAFFTMPLNCLTFGLFGYVLTFLLFYVVGNVVPGFHVTDIRGAVFGCLLLGIISAALSHFLIDRRS